MTAPWVLVPCLVQFRTELNDLAPGRDKASDGTIGNAAHAAEVSDHNPDETGSVPIHDADKINEVHAFDADDTLRQDFVTMEDVVQLLLRRCRSGAETRLRYLIYNRRIWSASTGWVEKPYTGASPHTEHAHLSVSYDSAKEASTASWRLADLKEKPPVALTAAENQAIATAVWAFLIEDYADPATPNRKLSAAVWAGYSDARRNSIIAAVADQRAHLDTRLDAIEASLAYLKSGLDTLTDEPATA